MGNTLVTSRRAILGALLRLERRKRGLAQADVSKRRCQPQVARMEKGAHDTALGLYWRFADKLGIPLWRLLERVEFYVKELPRRMPGLVVLDDDCAGREPVEVNTLLGLMALCLDPATPADPPAKDAQP